MNIKLITLTAALAMTAAMAQQEAEPIEAEASNEATTEAPAAPAPAPVEQKAETSVAKTSMPDLKLNDSPAVAANAEASTVNFNVVRGRAYNLVGNEAAAATVADNMNTPYRMANANLVYMEPAEKYAMVSFGTGLTKFFAFNNSTSQAVATAGIATKAFGIAVDFSLDKTWTSTETTTVFDKTTTTSSYVDQGDFVQAKLAAPLGPVDVRLTGYWRDFATSIDSTYEYKDNESKITDEINHNNWDLGGSLTLSNSPSGKTLFWSLGAGFLRHEIYAERSGKYKDADTSYSKTTKVTGENAYVQATPFFNIGATVLQNKKSRVLLGLNTSSALTFYDDFKDTQNKNDLEKDSYSSIAVYTVPNILAELALGNCWMIFAGASYQWLLFSRESEEFDDDYGDEFDRTKYNATVYQTATYGTSVDAGARFSYGSFAVEASLQDKFYDNPLVGFRSTDSDFIANLGMFIYF